MQKIKGVQCAFDARRAVEAFDLNSAFPKERRQDTFKGVHKRAPSMLPFYVWGYGWKTPLLCCGRRVGLVGTRVKQGDPAGPLFFAFSTFELCESIQDAVEKLVAEQLPLMPSYVGVTAVCDDLKVTCDPQLALPVSEVVQRKMAEASRGLNLSKCPILIHSDSADLVSGLVFHLAASYLPPPPGGINGYERICWGLLLAPRFFAGNFGNSRAQGHCLGAVLGEAGALGYLESAAILC